MLGIYRKCMENISNGQDQLNEGLYRKQGQKNMEDVRKWMESRLGSVPGLLAIIVTDRQITDASVCVHFHKTSLGRPA